LWTWRFGELVAKTSRATAISAQGRKIDPSLGFERRWVSITGMPSDACAPSWHGWLHHTVDVAPTEETYKPHEWEKPLFPT
jgi:NADH:ubiquinone oxidoreductase subunit